MGLVPRFFEITTKQWLLPGYAGEIPPVTTECKISAPCLILMLNKEEENDEIVRERKGQPVLRA